MIIVGTAGHIDHGKSSIVKQLTGSDPDRLPEEKKRGMTIDLGFAFYQTPDNDTLAFVDVPGHERFVKNMIAGAGGIDVVMLVVAADDGWMPQTEEHFQIVRLLGVKQGLIVINKSDLAMTATIEALQKEIKAKLEGTFLSGAPIFSVSSTTGAGFEDLRQHLNIISNKIRARLDIGKARLYIDRVFNAQGIGAVVTGTLKDGVFDVGQTVSIWPSLEKSKIKSLQSNNQNTNIAQPGQRAAVSLTGIGKEKLPRGGVLSSESQLKYLIDHPVLAMEIELLKNSPVILGDRRRVLLLVGTSECEAEIRLLDGQKVNPGQTAKILVKPDVPVYAVIGDHVILRLPTPMVTIGGGVVLDHLGKFPRKKDLDKFNYLSNREVFDLKTLLVNEIRKQIAIRPAEILRYSTYSKNEIENSIEELIKSGQCQMINEFIVDVKLADMTSQKILTIISEMSASVTTTKGATLEEISRATGIALEKQKVFLDMMIGIQKLELIDDRYLLSGSKEKISPAIEKAQTEILKKLKANKFTPPALGALITAGKTSKEAIRLLIKNSEVHKCGAEFLFTKTDWDDIITFIKMILSENNKLSVGELRDKFNFSRKYAIPILEETDRIKLTARNGDVRIKGANFEQ